MHTVDHGASVVILSRNCPINQEEPASPSPFPPRGESEVQSEVQCLAQKACYARSNMRCVPTAAWQARGVPYLSLSLTLYPHTSSGRPGVSGAEGEGEWLIALISRNMHEFLLNAGVKRTVTLFPFSRSLLLSSPVPPPRPVCNSKRARMAEGLGRWKEEGVVGVVRLNQSCFAGLTTMGEEETARGIG